MSRYATVDLPQELVAAVEQHAAEAGDFQSVCDAVALEFTDIKPDTVRRKWSESVKDGRISTLWLDRLVVALGVTMPSDGLEQPGLDAFCPLCREVVPTIHTGECCWCSAQTGGNTTTLHEDTRRKFPRLVTERVVQDARVLYLQGKGFYTISLELWPRTGYKTARSLQAALWMEWKHRGWQTRDKGEVTRARNFKHGLAPRGKRRPGYKRHLRAMHGEAYRPLCKATKTTYPQKGRPCGCPAMVGSDFCQAHDPARREQIEHRLADARAKCDYAAAAAALKASRERRRMAEATA